MKSVVLCGSEHYNQEIAQFCDTLEQAGILAFQPNINEPIFENEQIQ